MLTLKRLHFGLTKSNVRLLERNSLILHISYFTRDLSSAFKRHLTLQHQTASIQYRKIFGIFSLRLHLLNQKIEILEIRDQWFSRFYAYYKLIRNIQYTVYQVMIAMIQVSFFPCSFSNRKILNIQKLYLVLFSIDTFKIAKKKKKDTDAN